MWNFGGHYFWLWTRLFLAKSYIWIPKYTGGGGTGLGNFPKFYQFFQFSNFHILDTVVHCTVTVFPISIFWPLVVNTGRPNPCRSHWLAGSEQPRRLKDKNCPLLFPLLILFQRNDNQYWVGGGDKMQSWNWPVPTSGVIFQPIWGRKL